MNDWMLAAYCDSFVVTTGFGSGAPIEAAPAFAPSQLYWLKLRSSRVPTSVTTPTNRSLVPLAVMGAGVAAALSPMTRHRPLPTSICALLQAASTSAEVIRV